MTCRCDHPGLQNSSRTREPTLRLPLKRGRLELNAIRSVLPMTSLILNQGRSGREELVLQDYNVRSSLILTASTPGAITQGVTTTEHVLTS